NTNPTCRRRTSTPVASSPANSTLPLSAVSSPAMIRSSVVLPQPDGPSKATSSPVSICSDTSSSARKSPNRRERFLTSILMQGTPSCGRGPAQRGGRGGRLGLCLHAGSRAAPLDQVLDQQRHQCQQGQQRGHCERGRELVFVVKNLDVQ